MRTQEAVREYTREFTRESKKPADAQRAHMSLRVVPVSEALETFIARKFPQMVKFLDLEEFLSVESKAVGEQSVGRRCKLLQHHKQGKQLRSFSFSNDSTLRALRFGSSAHSQIDDQMVISFSKGNVAHHNDILALHGQQRVGANASELL